MEEPLQCWDFNLCPWEVRDVCPAYPNRGLECWKVKGTKCRGVEEIPEFVLKIDYCRDCEYYYEMNLSE